VPNKRFQVPVNLVNLASNPASGSEGDIYYNTADDTIRLYANGSWVNVGAAGPTNIHASAKLATTANITGTYVAGSLDQNGGYGIGATLTATATGRGTIDGVSITNGDRILVKNQSTSTQNGIYTVTNQGGTGVSFVLTRATDFDNSIANQVVLGDFLYVTNGTANATSNWILNSSGTAVGGAILIGTDAITFAQVGGVGPQGPTGPTGAGGALGYWGSFWSNQDQVAANTTTAYPITYNNTDPDSNGVSIVSNSRITFANAGVYNIEFSVQADRVSGSGTDTIEIWFRKNGTDVADSNSVVTVSGGAAAAKTIAAWNYMLELEANDYVELVWRTSDTRLELIADAAGTSPTRPAIPSVILTAHQVMYTQVGPTGPSGVINVTSPITNSGTSTSAQLGFDDSTFQKKVTNVSDTEIGYLDGVTSAIQTQLNAKAITADKLSQFASTTSSELAGVISDETGSGALVFGTSPTFTTSIIGGSTFSAFNTTNALTIGKSTGYSSVSATNNILSGGTIVDPSGIIPTITDNYSVRDINSTTYDINQIINIGTGSLNYSGDDATAIQNININTGGGNYGFRYTNIGSDSGNSQLNVKGSSTFNGNMQVNGELIVYGTTTTINTNTLTVDDKNIELGVVSAISGISGTISSTALTTTMTLTSGSTTSGLIPGMALTKNSGTGAFGTAPIITSIVSATSFTFTSTTANTAGSLSFNAGSASNLTADGGGITLYGATNKTFNWVNSTSAWTSSEHIALASGKNLLLNGATSGTITITPTAIAGTNTITLPAATGTLVLDNQAALTGTPTAPTAAANTNTTQIATTAYVVEHSETLVAKLTAATAAIANTETVILSFTAPANSIVAGDVFRFSGYATRAGGTGTAAARMLIRIGTTTLTGNIVMEVNPSSTSTGVYNFQGLVTVRTSGSSGTAGGVGQILYSTSTTAPVFTTPVTVNTTVSNLVEATIISGNSGNTYTFQHAILEKLPS